MRSKIRLLAGLSLALSTPCVNAKPVIFVPTADEGYAWWAKPLIIRPMLKAVGGVSVEAINAWRTANRGIREPEALCYLESVVIDGVVSPQRQTQLEINSTLSENPDSFDAIFSHRGIERFFVRVVAFETCGNESRSGTGILVTDEKGLFKSFIENDFLFTRLHKRDDGGLNVFGCYACGDVSELRYNPDGGEFYLKWIGH